MCNTLALSSISLAQVFQTSWGVGCILVLVCPYFLPFLLLLLSPTINLVEAKADPSIVQPGCETEHGTSKVSSYNRAWKVSMKLHKYWPYVGRLTEYICAFEPSLIIPINHSFKHLNIMGQKFQFQCTFVVSCIIFTFEYIILHISNIFNPFSKAVTELVLMSNAQKYT